MKLIFKTASGISKRDIIVSAIQERKILSITYKGFHRIIEPHAYGISTANNEVLRCFQVSGESSSGKPTGWKFMSAALISNIVDTGNTFLISRPGYELDDKNMKIILAQL